MKKNIHEAYKHYLMKTKNIRRLQNGRNSSTVSLEEFQKK